MISVTTGATRDQFTSAATRDQFTSGADRDQISYLWVSAAISVDLGRYGLDQGQRIESQDSAAHLVFLQPYTIIIIIVKFHTAIHHHFHQNWVPYSRRASSISHLDSIQPCPIIFITSRFLTAIQHHHYWIGFPCSHIPSTLSYLGSLQPYSIIVITFGFPTDTSSSSSSSKLFFSLWEPPWVVTDASTVELFD